MFNTGVFNQRKNLWEGYFQRITAFLLPEILLHRDFVAPLLEYPGRIRYCGSLETIVNEFISNSFKHAFPNRKWRNSIDFLMKSLETS